MEGEKITWTAPEYIHTEKNSDWFWVFGIITASLVIAALIVMNIVLAIILILGSFSLIMLSLKKPNDVYVEVNEKGVIVGKNFYPYKNLDSFGIEYYENFSRLIVQSKKFFMPHISVIINEEQIDSEYLKEYLEEFLDEEEHSESLIYKISEKIGF